MNLIKITAILLTSAMLLTAFSAYTEYISDTAVLAEDYFEETYENLTYRQYDGYIAITGCDDSAESVKIPDNIGGVPVTEIGDNAFLEHKNLAEVKLPDTIEKIGEFAFRECTSLKSIVIPESMESIGWFAFYGCSKLEDITFPDKLVRIADHAFSGTAWYRSKPEGLIYIGKMAYYYKGYPERYCSLKIADGTLGLADGTFYFCSDIQEVTVPESVEVIDSTAFYLCANLKRLTILNPECEIFDESSTVCNEFVAVCYYGGVICGYENSTAQKYAEKYGYMFESLGEYPSQPESETLYGDANCDGEISVADATLILQYLGNSDKYKLSEQGRKNADIVGGNDGISPVDALAVQMIDAGMNIDSLNF